MLGGTEQGDRTLLDILPGQEGKLKRLAEWMANPQGKHASFFGRMSTKNFKQWKMQVLNNEIPAMPAAPKRAVASGSRQIQGPSKRVAGAAVDHRRSMEYGEEDDEVEELGY